MYRPPKALVEAQAEQSRRAMELARKIAEARVEWLRPLCRDCADFGPICPNTSRPCGFPDAATKEPQQ